MTIPEKAVENAVSVALDDSHGYDQINRWGNPDTDCSALIIKSYKDAGLTDLKSTYTGNMKLDFLQHGFRNVIYEVNIVTGAGMKPGDVLLNEVHHTAMYIGNGKIVHATGNELGGVTGGKPGDSLWQIAADKLGNGWSWYRIANENNIPFPYTIHPGDKLKIPVKE